MQEIKNGIDRTHLNEIEKAYRIFENREDGVIKVAIRSV